MVLEFKEEYEKMTGNKLDIDRDDNPESKGGELCGWLEKQMKSHRLGLRNKPSCIHVKCLLYFCVAVLVVVVLTALVCTIW